MPYPFAHPAAVLPLARLLGRAGSPSALAIGSMIPDAWYFVPGLVRADSHGAAGLLWFCLLLPRLLACRLARYAGRPRAPWPGLREALREAWVGGMSALGAALLTLGLAWKLRR